MTNEEILKRLSDAVVNGKVEDSKKAAQEALDTGMAALDAINDGLVNGMSIVGDKYAAHQVYLPQVLMSAHTMYAGLDILLPAIPKAQMDKMLKAATAVVEGDVHDIGKNIVKTMLTAGGFEVIDLGKDAPIDTIIESVEKYNLDVLVHPHDAHHGRDEECRRRTRRERQQEQGQGVHRRTAHIPRVRRGDRCGPQGQQRTGLRRMAERSDVIPWQRR